MSSNNVNLQTTHKIASLKSVTRQCRQAQSSRLQNSSQRHKWLSSSKTITNTKYKMAQLFHVSKEAVDYENLSFEYLHSRLDQPWWWWALKTIEVNLKLGITNDSRTRARNMMTFFISSECQFFFVFFFYKSESLAYQFPIFLKVKFFLTVAFPCQGNLLKF